MFNRRWTNGLAIALALVFSAAVAAQKNDKKQDDTQKKETQFVVKVADDASGGMPVPNDLGVTWAHEDFLKAQGNKEYVPFIVTIDPTKVTSNNIPFYWRVVSKSSAPTATPAADPKSKDKDKDKDKKKSEYPYEDISFVPVQSG